MADMDRRLILSTAAGAMGLPALGLGAEIPKNSESAQKSISYCLNTATIRGQNLPLDRQFQLARESGYDGIEPWLGEMDKYQSSGKSLADLGKWARDNQLSVEGCIGFPEWLVNDSGKRKKSLEQLKKDLEKLVALGCQRIAAPPAGATQEKGIPLPLAAERFAPLAKLCVEAGIVPLVEIWGFSSAINRLGDAVYVTSECGVKGASVLADIYHLRKGGSSLQGLAQLGPQSLQILHINDYPKETTPSALTDADRVFPGDGAAPWKEVLEILSATTHRCVVSLELFNRDVWKMDPKVALDTGLQKMKKVIGI